LNITKLVKAEKNSPSKTAKDWPEAGRTGRRMVAKLLTGDEAHRRQHAKLPEFVAALGKEQGNLNEP
jgi:hypothetical protein